MKRRLFLHACTLFFGYLIITKLMGVMVISMMLPKDTTATWAVLFIFFLFSCLYFVIKKVDAKQRSSWGKMLLVTGGGALIAWLLLVAELHYYRMGKDISTSINPFADELMMAATKVFPLLLIGGILFKYAKNWKTWQVGVLAGTFVLGTGLGLANLMNLPDFKQVESTVQKASPDYPNVVLILADDLGYNDISLHGNPLIKTPHIDAIAQNGVDFTRGYCSAPICAPSRAGLFYIR